jgi:hypothetical protein
MKIIFFSPLKGFISGSKHKGIRSPIKTFFTPKDMFIPVKEENSSKPQKQTSIRSVKDL